MVIKFNHSTEVNRFEDMIRYIKSMGNLGNKEELVDWIRFNSLKIKSNKFIVFCGNKTMELGDCAKSKIGVEKLKKEHEYPRYLVFEKGIRKKSLE